MPLQLTPAPEASSPIFSSPSISYSFRFGEEAYTFDSTPESSTKIKSGRAGWALGLGVESTAYELPIQSIPHISKIFKPASLRRVERNKIPLDLVPSYRV